MQSSRLTRDFHLNLRFNRKEFLVVRRAADLVNQATGTYAREKLLLAAKSQPAATDSADVAEAV